MSDEHKNETYPLHFALLLVGGLCLGVGMINLIGSLGWTGGDFNSNLSLIGFSGLDNMGVLPDAAFSFPLVVVGAVCLIVANATAWRQTDGY